MVAGGREGGGGVKGVEEEERCTKGTVCGTVRGKEQQEGGGGGEGGKGKMVYRGGKNRRGTRSQRERERERWGGGG